MVIPDKSENFAHLSIILLGSICGGIGMIYPSPASHSIVLDLSLSKFELAVFNSVSQLASVLGPILANILLQELGRRNAHRIVLFISFCSWLLLSLSQPLHRFFCIAHRFLFGISLGGFFTVVPIYVMELVPIDRRSLYGPLPQFGIALGGLIVNLVGMFCDWFSLAVFCSCVPFLALMLSLFIPESPVSARARAREHDPDRESLFTVNHHRSLVLGSLLFLFQQFSGINPIQVNLSRLLQTKSGPTIAFSAKAIAAFISIPCVSYLGRQWTWIVSSIGCSLFLFVLVYSITKNMESLSVGACFGSLFAFSLGLGPIPSFIAPELFSDTLRSKGTSFLQMFNCSVSFLLTFAYPYVGDAFGYSTIFSILGLAMVGSGLFGLAWFPRRGASVSTESLTAMPGDRLAFPASLPGPELSDSVL
jgi:SP family facilitated glucose transporter-like MFS transporter 8